MRRLTVRGAVQTCILVLGLLVTTGTVPSLAQNETELAKKVQNPVADLISVPLQSNFNFGVGPDDDLQYVLNIQPVLPLRLSQDWNLIVRTTFLATVAADAKRTAQEVAERIASYYKQQGWLRP